MVDFFKMLTGKTKEELIRPEIFALRARGNVTWADWDQPMNSYERDELLPALTNEAFLRHFIHCAENVGWEAMVGTYDYSMSRKLAPEAKRRGLDSWATGAVEARVFWRGSVTDLVTDLEALLSLEQLQELAGEAALAVSRRKKEG